MSRAPIMMGSMKLPKGPLTMIIVEANIKMPCIPTMVLYVLGLK